MTEDTEAELRAQVERLEQDVADMQETLTDAVAAGTLNADDQVDDDEAEPFVPVYTDVEQWVAGSFAPVFARSAGTNARWCPKWWDHGEAVLRLTALWRTWETMRLDPAMGIARWLRDHLDPQLAALLDDGGTFRACTPTEHSPMPALPLTAAPAGYWQAPYADPEVDA